jgi:hypothetical protein
MMYGRRLRQLVVVWVVSFVMLAGIYRLEVRIPAAHEILLPLYWVVFGTAAFSTWRWMRARSRGDRRIADRRAATPRDDEGTPSGRGP